MKKNFILGSLMLGVAGNCFAQFEVATFENLELPDNSYWCGELDEEDEDMGFSTSWFHSGSFEFNNFYWPDYSTWSFFAYSSRTEKTFKAMTDDQFNSITGGGADDSRIFGVVFPASYMGKTVMEVGYGSEPIEIPGMEIVNTAWVVDCILNGDGYEGPFETGDWMTLKLTGFVNDVETVSQDYYLADYRSENTAEHYYIDSWTWIDMSGLGEVTSVQFSIDSSKKNAYGVTTPTYVCIDNVGISEKTNIVDNIVSSLINLQYIGSSKHVLVGGNLTRANYTIINMAGQTTQRGIVEKGRDTIDLSGLAPGIYLVTVHNGSESKSLKVII